MGKSTTSSDGGGGEFDRLFGALHLAICASNRRHGAQDGAADNAIAHPAILLQRGRNAALKVALETYSQSGRRDRTPGLMETHAQQSWMQFTYQSKHFCEICGCTF